MVIAEKRINIDIVDVDAQSPADDLLESNPYGTVPTLVDRDLRLYESLIVMEYLDERFPHPPLLPVDPVGRANARLFIHRIDVDWYQRMRAIRMGDAAEAETARKELIESLVAVAPIFAANRFFMSDEFSLVDCCVAPMLWRLPVLELELPAAASPVTEYAARIFEWPSFRSSLTEAERDMVTGLA
jgi:RNA polymerase-associated protein